MLPCGHQLCYNCHAILVKRLPPMLPQVRTGCVHACRCVPVRVCGDIRANYEVVHMCSRCLLRTFTESHLRSFFTSKKRPSHKGRGP
jgi:hypothetical protein